jgi:chromosome segregation ATPase
MSEELPCGYAPEGHPAHCSLCRIRSLQDENEKLRGENYDLRRWSDAPQSVEIYKAEADNLRSCVDGWVSNWKQQCAEVERLRSAWADDHDDLTDQLATLTTERDSLRAECVEARAAYRKESELASAMLAEVDRLRALLSETQDEERKRCKTIGELGGTATELRTRRAQDLTDEEREALRYGHDVIRGSMVARYSRHDEACEKSLAILDRLLSRGGGE